MHILHLLAVEAATAQEAVEAAESYLGPYCDDVFDWYEVGGRWTGVLGNDDDALCATEDLPRFLKAVDDAVAARQAEMREMRRWLAGPDGSGEVYNAFGLLGDVTDEDRSRFDQMYTESAAVFTEALHSPTVEDPRFEMIGYRMATLGRLLAGYYTFNSRFFDTVTGGPGPADLRERVLADPGRQWLVAVDLHN